MPFFRTPTGAGGATRGRLLRWALVVPTDEGATASLPPKGVGPDHWQFVVAAHPSPEHIGVSVELGLSALQLGRGGDALGPSALDVASLSRQHARIVPGPQGRPRIEDVGSRNGTYVNAKRIDACRLESGDVVGVGSLLGLVVMEEPHPAVVTPDGFVAESRGLRRSFKELGKALKSGGGLVHGESGAGASALVAAVAAAAEREDKLWISDCARTDWALPAPAPGSVLVLDAIDALTPAGQHALQQVVAELRDQSVAIVSLSTSSSSQLRRILEPRLHNRLLRWEIEVLPLRERKTDIVPLALRFAQRYAGKPTGLTPELTFALLRHSWPGNAHELEAIIERAVVDAPAADVIDVFEGLEGLLLSPPNVRAIGSVLTREPSPGYAVERSGAWIERPDGVRHRLAHRPALSRLVAAFVDARERWPGRAMTVRELVERGWPGERIVPRAAANRVYVAMTTLRKLGLRDLLVRTEDGYLFDAEAPLRIHAA